ncbi:hypothetical protein BGZ60DRAFT_535249 [Tricladium varicosporioides]|nr:hypothetical protein BGZ60DRAFT_535249 [Hymenoscyphus varicosporioides]
MSVRKSWNPFTKNKRELERLQQEQYQQSQIQLRTHREELDRQEKARQEQVKQLQRQVAYQQEELKREKAAKAAQERAAWEQLQREEAERQRLLQIAKTERENRVARKHQISPESLRNLRELIRTRYALDVEIWRLRDVRRVNQPLVIAKMEKADAVLADIISIVLAWEGTESSWTPSEWEQAMQVKRRLLVDNKRWWLKTGPPWEDVQPSPNMRESPHREFRRRVSP